PVLLHTSDTDRAFLMFNELRFAGWTVEIVERAGGPANNWIKDAWLPDVRRMLAEQANTWEATLPPDHAERVARMMSSLDGLSIGDALGEMLVYRSHSAPESVAYAQPV